MDVDCRWICKAGPPTRRALCTGGRRSTRIPGKWVPSRCGQSTAGPPTGPPSTIGAGAAGSVDASAPPSLLPRYRPSVFSFLLFGISNSLVFSTILFSQRTLSLLPRSHQLHLFLFGFPLPSFFLFVLPVILCQRNPSPPSLNVVFSPLDFSGAYPSSRCRPCLPSAVICLVCVLSSLPSSRVVSLLSLPPPTIALQIGCQDCFLFLLNCGPC